MTEDHIEREAAGSEGEHDLGRGLTGSASTIRHLSRTSAYIEAGMLRQEPRAAIPSGSRLRELSRTNTYILEAEARAAAAQG